MSSAAIMAKIKQKEAEKAKLEALRTEVNKVYESASCVESKFKEAAANIEGAGTIDGKPLDGGKTTITGENIAKIVANTEGTLGDIDTSISSLEAEIASLYQQYYAALKAEEEARAAARANTSTTEE